MAITLYGGAQTRASMPRWYMAEKGIPYELVDVSIGASQPFSLIFWRQLSASCRLA